MNTWTIYCDGASKGNPGHAGGGVVIHQNENNIPIIEKSFYFGSNLTNNQAEYLALLSSLFYLNKLAKVDDKIEIYSDSLLMVRQLNEEYRVKNSNIIPLFNGAVECLKKYRGVMIYHILREKNHHADRLANEGVIHAKQLPESLDVFFKHVYRNTVHC